MSASVDHGAVASAMDFAPASDPAHDDLATLAAAVLGARLALDHARQALRDDKARRRSAGLTARIVDRLSTTPAEATERELTEQFDALISRASKVVIDWVHSRAVSLMREAGQAECHAALTTALAEARWREAQVVDRCRLATDAQRALAAAKAQCESASTAELVDAVTSSKKLAALSTCETLAAKDALHAAAAATHALKAALPQRVDALVVDLSDDLVDLSVDLVVAPALDVLSWMSVAALDEAATACNEALAALQPLADRLERLASRMHHRLEKAQADLADFEAPFVDAAHSQVPPALRVA